MTDYENFIESKRHTQSNLGIQNTWMPNEMFDFQKFVTERTILKGRYAGFIDTGLGKTLIELTVAYNYVLETGNARTNFHDVDKNLIEEHDIETFRWHKLNVKEFHSVTITLPPRIVVSVSVYWKTD